MSLPGAFLWCFGTAALLSVVSCLALGLIWRRRLEALKKEVAGLSEDLLQLVELQMDTYHQVRRSVTDLEEKIIELSLPSSDVPLPLERRHQVLTLARKGVSVDEIARRLNMPRGEAELILNLRKYANSKGTPERRNIGLQERHAPLSP